MAIRVEPGSDLDHGVMRQAVAVTHVRVRPQGNAAAATVRPLAQTLNVGANERLVIPSTAFDAVFPDGELSRGFTNYQVRRGWEGVTFEVDAMTDANTVVADAGYSQVTHAAWAFTSEND